MFAGHAAKMRQQFPEPFDNRPIQAVAANGAASRLIGTVTALTGYR